MNFIPAQLDGAFFIAPEPIEDRRGFFLRTFCARTFAERGLVTRYVQHSRSLSRTLGTLRGLHFQDDPHGEVKIVSCVSGAIFDVIADLRPASPTYLRWQAFELTAENRASLYVPQGFAHGFQTLTPDAEVNYLISAYHAPHAARGVRYDDPVLAVEWPRPVAEISDRDLSWPYLDLEQSGSRDYTGLSSPAD